MLVILVQDVHLTVILQLVMMTFIVTHVTLDSMVIFVTKPAQYTVGVTDVT